MKIESKIRDDHQAVLTVEVEPEQMEQAREKALRQLARRVKLPGFRPGKAPAAMIRRQISDEALFEEVVEGFIEDQYPAVIEESGIEPYGPGSLERIVSQDPLVLEFLVPLKAQVRLGDYRSIRIEYTPPVVQEAEVDAALKNLREQNAIREPVERPAQPGDQVGVRLSAERNPPAADGSDLLIRERLINLNIPAEGEAELNPYPFPGYTSQLVGRSIGDSFDSVHVYSEDSGYESLRGVTGTFHTLLDTIQSRTLPELDDEFARTVSEYETLEAFRLAIQKEMQEGREDEYNDEYLEKVITRVVEESEFKYPPQMLDHEIEHVIESLEERLDASNLTMDLYLKERGITLEDLKKEAAPVAETRMKRSLAILEISYAEAIEPDQQTAMASATQALGELTRQISKKDRAKLQDERVIRNLVGNALMEDMISRTRTRLRAIASGQAEQAALTEAEAAPEATEGEPAGEQIPAPETGAEPK